MSTDLITLEIIFNALRSVADETYVALMRSAYSTNIKERNDHSTALVYPTDRCTIYQTVKIKKVRMRFLLGTGLHDANVRL